MFKEACTDFTKESYINLEERDKDVNRLHVLLCRSALYHLENPSIALKNYGFTSVDLLTYHFNGYYLESVADEVRRMARFLYKIKISTKEKKLLENLLFQINDYYIDVMKSIYNRDEELAFSLALEKKRFYKELDVFRQRNKIEHYDQLIARISRLISNVHNLVKAVYQGYNYSSMVN